MEQYICKRIIYSYTGKSPQKNPTGDPYILLLLEEPFYPVLGLQTILYIVWSL